MTALAAMALLFVVLLRGSSGGPVGPVAFALASQSPSPSDSPSPSPLPTGPSGLSLAVTPGVAVWGTQFTISGQLVCFGSPVAGALVTIATRIGGTQTFEPAGSAQTDSNGVYLITLTPDRSAEYQAMVPGGTGACNAGNSPIARGDVRPGVATNLQRPSLPAGQYAVLNGWVLPAHPGRKVYLQIFQSASKTWANAVVAALDSASRYRVAYRKTSPGVLIIRMVFPTQDLNHTWNVGRNLKITWTDIAR